MADVFVFSMDGAKAHAGNGPEGYGLETVLKYVSDDLQAETLKRYYPDGTCYIWAVPDRDENRSTWNLINENDLILAYRSRSIIAAASAFLTVDAPSLAESLWGDKGSESRLICFSDKPYTGEVPLIPQLERYLDRGFTGFTKLDPEKCENILSDYGSFEVFLRLGLKYDFPFSFRHSE